jgi:uncharacterized protein (DUF736 family)
MKLLTEELKRQFLANGAANAAARSATARPKISSQSPHSGSKADPLAVFSGLGAAWKRTSKAGAEFLSVTLDDRALPKALSAAPMPGQNDCAILIRSRPAKAKRAD